MDESFYILDLPLPCGYDKEVKAARAYDLAALKYWGLTATTNFPISNYSKELQEMKNMTKQEFIASLRRKSNGFSRGASIYRGVTRHHQPGRWQARIGRAAGNKDLYLGTFATEGEAADAYDIAAIKFRGVNAVTNFEMNRYDVEAIAKSSLPITGAAKRLKLCLESEQKTVLNHDQQPQCSSNNICFDPMQQSISTIPCGISFDAAALYQQNLYHHLQSAANIGISVPPGSSSTTATPMTLMSQPEADQFFLWPQQPY
ncbi:AP2-like ethylene-responsive transcription factor AIL6 [Hibiscus syriacus]|uniref:AP2-like ethylene-responsive transcription factor AIL6 n=1 Tax=Hibiscus syriacus TaxID=106335 RepID=A0A6A3AXR3_HIBSY|nr:AP2-like ethylene-responsive transcription factor AIL6 [Hibiscus syriacus]